MTPGVFPHRRAVRLAATVMLMRDGADGVELLLVRRSSRSAFAPDAFVFPGGTVDEIDYRVQDHVWSARVTTEFRARVHEALPCSEPPVEPAEALALVAAAVRELREEAGIAIAPSALRYFSHWITPPTEPRRYDTHFFVARAPNDSQGVADAIETHDAQWVAPRAALARHKRGDMHLVYPTIKHLERLLEHESVEAVLAYAAEKTILTVMPDRAPSEGFEMPSSMEGRW